MAILSGAVESVTTRLLLLLAGQLRGNLKTLRQFDIPVILTPQTRPAATMFTNNGKHPVVLYAKFQRTNNPAWPLGDPYVFLCTKWPGDGLGAAAPQRPVNGWPLGHGEEVNLVVGPGETVYCFVSVVGPTGFIWFGTWPES